MDNRFKRPEWKSYTLKVFVTKIDFEGVILLFIFRHIIADSLQTRDDIYIYNLQIIISLIRSFAWWWSPIWRRQLTGPDLPSRGPEASRNVPFWVAQVAPLHPPLLVGGELHSSPNRPRITTGIRLFDQQILFTCWNLNIWTFNSSSSHHFLFIR